MNAGQGSPFPRFVFAAALVHALFFLAWRAPPDPVLPNPVPSPELDVVLQGPVAPVRQSLRAVAPAATPDESIPQPRPRESYPSRESLAPASSPAAPRLDPGQLDSFLRSLPLPETTTPAIPGLEFRGALAKAVEQRRGAQDRQRDNAAARAVRDGLKPEVFNRIASSGRHIKTDQGCFDRRADVAGGAGDGLDEARFWMVRCRESRGKALALFEDR